MKKERMERLPVNENDLAGVVAWLAEMAGKGLFLTETAGMWWYFREGEPERLCYRLDLMEEGQKKLKEETRTAYEENGWTYVTTHETLYHIFSGVAGETGEPYPDSRVRGVQIRMYERRMKTMFWSAAAVFLLAVVSHREFFAEVKARPALSLADAFTPMLLLELMVFVLFLIQNARNVWIVTQLRKQTSGQDGRYVPPETAVSGTGRKPYGKIIQWVLIGLFGVFMLRSCGRGGPIEQQLEAGDVFFALQYIEEGTVESLSMNEERGTGDVIYYASPFVKEHYEVSQLGRIKADAEDRGYLASLNAEYYETYSEKMAQEILEEWLKEGAAELKEQNAEGFDVYLLAEEAGSRLGLPEQKLFARHGSKVLSLTYVGRESLAEKAGILRELIE